MLEYLLKFVVGGCFVVLVPWLAQNKNSSLAGIVVLFPAVTVVSYFFVAKSVELSSLRLMVLYSLWGLIPLVVFLVSMFVSLRALTYMPSVMVSLSTWFIAAYVIYRFAPKPI